MKKEIIINASKDRSRIAIVEDGELVELYVENPENVRTIGNIYLGQVQKVMPAIRAGFVDIGEKQDAFLHFSDLTDNAAQLFAMAGEDVPGLDAPILSRAPQKRVADDEDEPDVEEKLEVESGSDESSSRSRRSRRGRGRGRGRGRSGGGRRREEEEEEEERPRRGMVIDLTSGGAKSPAARKPSRRSEPRREEITRDEPEAEKPQRDEPKAKTPEDAKADAPKRSSRRRSDDSSTADDSTADSSKETPSAKTTGSGGDDAEASADQPRPRRRSRSRKRSTDSAETTEAPQSGVRNDDSSSEEKEADTPRASKDDTTPRSGRGRSKKRDDSANDDSPEPTDAPAGGAAAALDALFEEKPERPARRATRAKTVDLTADADDASAQDDTSGDQTDQGESGDDSSSGRSRRRGRRGGRGRSRSSESSDADSLDSDSRRSGMGDDESSDKDSGRSRRRSRGDKSPDEPSAEASADEQKTDDKPKRRKRAVAVVDLTGGSKPAKQESTDDAEEQSDTPGRSRSRSRQEAEDDQDSSRRSRGGRGRSKDTDSADEDDSDSGRSRSRGRGRKRSDDDADRSDDSRRARSKDTDDSDSSDSGRSRRRSRNDSDDGDVGPGRRSRKAYDADGEETSDDSSRSRGGRGRSKDSDDSDSDSDSNRGRRSRNGSDDADARDESSDSRRSRGGRGRSKDNDDDSGSDRGRRSKKDDDDRSSGRGNGRSSNGRGSDRGRGNGRSSGTRTTGPVPPAHELMRRGTRVLCKVTKEPISSKGSRVSTDISLAGRFLVLVPAADYIAVSKKIESSKERRRLKSLAQSLKPDDCGVIVRTVAEGRDAKSLDNDLRLLIQKWDGIKAKLVGRPNPPVTLYEDVNMVSSIIRDLFSEDFDRILIDDPKVFKNVKAYVQAVAPDMADNVVLHNSKTPVYRSVGLEKQVEEAFSRRVNLKGGGYLFIETTEAMHVVDVNSGRAGRGKSQKENLMSVNLESAREVAKQLRLRDLGGIIVVDFIDLRHESDRRKVTDELKKAFKRDRAVTKLLPMSDFGLVQITRQRLRPSITAKTTDDDGQPLDAADAAAAAGASEISQPAGRTYTEPEVQPEPAQRAPTRRDAPRQDSAPLAATPAELAGRIRGWLDAYRAQVDDRYRGRPIIVRVHPLLGAFLRRGFPSTLTRWRFSVRGISFRVDEDPTVDPLGFDVRDEKSGRSLLSKYSA